MGGAHKSVWHCKGDAGTKLCMLCKNLYAEKSELVDEDGSDLLTCSLVHESDLDFATNEDILGAARRLASKAGTEPAQRFALRQQAVGLRHEPDGLLLDRELAQIVRPAQQFCHDWMHAMFVHGVFNTVGFLLLEALIQTGVRDIWDTFYNYVGLWVLPHRVANASLRDVFEPKRQKSSRKARHIKCTASEGLSLLPIVAFFVHSVLLKAGRCMAECKAFLALADVVDLLSAVPLGIVTADTLRLAIKGFLDCCILAGWRRLMHPKFHWLVHLPRHLQHFKCLPTCWVHERKHRMVKRYATDIYNTRTFEGSVLAQVHAHHIAALTCSTTFDTSVGLISAVSAPPKMKLFLERELQMSGFEILCSREARISKFTTCCKGDVVMIKSLDRTTYVAGQIWFLASVHGEPCAVVAVWRLIKFDIETSAAEWEEEGDPSPSIMHLDEIVASVTYTRCRPGVCRVLVPLHLRSGM